MDIPAERIRTWTSHQKWEQDRYDPKTRAEFPIGGSDAAGIVGVSPWQTSYSTWARHQPEYDPTPDRAKAAIFARGHKWEPRVLDDYAEDTGFVVSPSRKLPWFRALPGVPKRAKVVQILGEQSWQRATLDAVALDDKGVMGIVEAKSSMKKHDWGVSGTVIEAWEDGAESIVPPYYATQCYWYLGLTGAPWIDLAVLIADFGFPELRRYRLMADLDVQWDLFDTIAAWRERHLLNGEPPPVDGSEGAKEHIASKYPLANKRIRSADLDEADLIAEWKAADEILVSAKAEKKSISNQITLCIGEDYAIKCNAGRATWFNVGGRTSVDQKRLKEEFPEAYQACLRLGNPYRALKVT